jgi:hypothetical protein
VTIQRFRQKSGGRCFADAARAAKQICVMQAVVFDRVAQSARNRFLTGNFFKRLRSPFAGNNLI